MTDVRHILVLPDREAAEEVAEELAGDLADRFGDGTTGDRGGDGGGFDAATGNRSSDGSDDGFGNGPDDGSDDGSDDLLGGGAGGDGELQVVREALAGEDDAEDAQWLVVLQGPRERYDPERLDALAQSYDGWLERS